MVSNYTGTLGLTAISYGTSYNCIRSDCATDSYTNAAWVPESATLNGVVRYRASTVGGGPATTYTWKLSTGSGSCGTYTTSLTPIATCDSPFIQYLTTSASVYYYQPLISPQERLREIMRERYAPRFLDKELLQKPEDIREVRARETLHRLIGDDKFRLFLKKGFISIRNPKSGLVFQIFPGHGITNVYDRGKMVERLCVVLRGDFPPTDSLIVRYLMILNNEEQFRSYAIKHAAFNTVVDKQSVLGNRPLPSIFADLKKAA